MSSISISSHMYQPPPLAFFIQILQEKQQQEYFEEMEALELCNHAGELYRTSNLDGAMEQYEAAGRLMEVIPPTPANQILRASILEGLANVYAQKASHARRESADASEYDERAIEHYTNALQVLSIAETEEALRICAEIHSEFGDAFSNQNRYAEAAEQYGHAMQIIEAFPPSAENEQFHLSMSRAFERVQEILRQQP